MARPPKRPDDLRHHMLGLLQFDQLMHAVADGQGVVLGRSQSLTRVFREGKLVAQAQAHRA